MSPPIEGGRSSDVAVVGAYEGPWIYGAYLENYENFAVSYYSMFLISLVCPIRRQSHDLTTPAHRHLISTAPREVHQNNQGRSSEL